MKKFLCNLIVPAVMFASLLTLPLWADRPAPKAADAHSGAVQTQDSPARSPELQVVAGVAEHR